MVLADNVLVIAGDEKFRNRMFVLQVFIKCLVEELSGKRWRDIVELCKASVW